MFNIPNFQQIRNTILQEIRGLTGINAPDDSDAAIRADGTASAVDSLYSHQSYIQKQLFIATADEPYLYIHAEGLSLPRLGGNFASGTVTAISNVDLTISAGSKLTNGKGYYWSVANDAVLKANVPFVIDVIADQVGASWNYNDSLLWISPQAGLSGTTTNVSIGGGSDQEELENWRARLSERNQLGLSRDREADLKAFLKALQVFNTFISMQSVEVYPIDRVDDWDVENFFRPTVERKVRRCEIELFSNRYFHRDLEQYHDETVLVGYDIHCAEKITVRDLLQISGRDMVGQLIDCSVPIKNSRQVTLEILLQEFVVDERFLGLMISTGIMDNSWLKNKVTVEPGESIYDAISKAAQVTGQSVWFDYETIVQSGINMKVAC
jgi:hypothetical protein